MEKVHWLCWWGSVQCQGEDTCAPSNHLHTWDSAVLWPAKRIWINLHPSNGLWVLDQLIQHFYVLWHCGMSRCTPRLRPHQSFSSDQERVSVPRVRPVPCFGRATSEHMDRLASRCNYTRRCTTITNGNSAQETSAEPAWGKTSQRDLFPLFSTDRALPAALHQLPAEPSNLPWCTQV